MVHVEALQYLTVKVNIEKEIQRKILPREKMLIKEILDQRFEIQQEASGSDFTQNYRLELKCESIDFTYTEHSASALLRADYHRISQLHTVLCSSPGEMGVEYGILDDGSGVWADKGFVGTFIADVDANLSGAMKVKAATPDSESDGGKIVAGDGTCHRSEPARSITDLQAGARQLLPSDVAAETSNEEDPALPAVSALGIEGGVFNRQPHRRLSSNPWLAEPAAESLDSVSASGTPKTASPASASVMVSGTLKLLSPPLILPLTPPPPAPRCSRP
jgi:hypothetical protein